MKHLANLPLRLLMHLAVEIIRVGTITLLAYAAASKMLDATLFRAQLHDSPYLIAYADILTWLVPYSELLICVLLVLDKTKRAGLYAAFLLMLAFTGYIILMLAGPASIPCSCGGILQRMGWGTHLLFNALVSGFLLAGILLSYRQKPISNNDTSIAQRVRDFRKPERE